MRVLVCGGRNYHDQRKLYSVLDRAGVTTLIEGGARGADRLAREWALARLVTIETFEAEWDKYGNAAGPIRNTRMIDEGRPDVVIAFPSGSGTADMVRKAERAGIHVIKVAE